MKLDDVKKLHQKKYRQQFGYYLVEGEHLILELFKAVESVGTHSDIHLYITEARQDFAQPFAQRCTIHTVSNKVMQQLSDTKTPQGVVARVPLPDASSGQGLDATATDAQYIYLHEIQDPGNLGTILRSMAWFGDTHLLLSPNCVDPYNSKVVRASMGAIFHTPIEQDVTLDMLNERFSSIAYLDMQGEAMTAPSFKQFPCYVFGNEARGVPLDALSDIDAQAYTIPGSGKIDSLNLASAVTLALFSLQN